MTDGFTFSDVTVFHFTRNVVSRISAWLATASGDLLLHHATMDTLFTLLQVRHIVLFNTCMRPFCQGQGERLVFCADTIPYCACRIPTVK
jgi:hypothetical protein